MGSKCDYLTQSGIRDCLGDVNESDGKCFLLELRLTSKVEKVYRTKNNSK